MLSEKKREDISWNPRMTEDRHELRQVIAESAEGRDFSLSLRGFLDYFYAVREKNEMFALIGREPLHYDNVPAYQYTLCAAAAHKLANVIEECLEVIREI